MKAIESVSRETRERLAVYVDLLMRWNKHIRLTNLSFDDPSRNPVDESLALVDLLATKPATALDIGSGNGLPAIPISIATGIPYVLVEADRRKAAFLREVTREVACPATVEAARIEDTPPQPFELITARAFARLHTLVTLAHPRQACVTVCLFPKGPAIEDELAEASRDWLFSANSHPTSHGQVVEIRSIVPRL